MSDKGNFKVTLTRMFLDSHQRYNDTLRDAPMAYATKEELQRFVKLQEKLRLAIWAFQDTRSLRTYEELQNALDASRTFIEALHKRVHGETVRRLNG